MAEIVTIRLDSDTSRSTLPIDVVYSTIGRQVEPSVLGQYLRTICSYEMETVDVMEKGSNEKRWSNFIVRDHLLAKGAVKKTVTDSSIRVTDDLQSVLSTDHGYLSASHTNIRAHILTYNDVYIGHLYTWESEDTLYVDAIRSSITNILDRSRGEGVKGIVSMLMDSSIKIARLYGMDTVTVHDPFPVTKHVLDAMGFGDDNVFVVERAVVRPSPKYRLAISSE